MECNCIDREYAAINHPLVFASTFFSLLILIWPVSDQILVYILFHNILPVSHKLCKPDVILIRKCLGHCNSQIVGYWFWRLKISYMYLLVENIFNLNKITTWLLYMIDCVVHNLSSGHSLHNLLCSLPIFSPFDPLYFSYKNSFGKLKENSKPYTLMTETNHWNGDWTSITNHFVSSKISKMEMDITLAMIMATCKIYLTG
jgi:hypothetical protein